jgi:DNA-binding MarR family transcriptional regulator
MALSEESIEVTRLLKEVIVFFKHKMNKAFEKSGLTVPQGMLLAVLGKEGKLNIHELGDRLFMTNSTVSGVVDRLEKLGIVERARCSEDKRVVYVSLSPQFEEKRENLKNFMNKHIENVIIKATPEELEDVRHGLNILKRLMGGAE